MIKIVIAEDQGMLLGAMKALINMEDDMDVVAIAQNGEEALEKIAEHQPDIIIMDIEMPGKTGLDVAEQLKDQEYKIIILTTFIVNLRHLPFGFSSLLHVSSRLLRSSTENNFSNSAKSFSLRGLRLPNERIW